MDNPQSLGSAFKEGVDDMAEDRPTHQPIHPDVRPLLDPEYAAFHDKYFQYIIPDDRKVWDGSARLKNPSVPAMEGQPVEVGKVQDIDLGNFTVRVFTPEDSDASRRGTWPAFMWFHGGGWAVGDVNMSNDMCSLICKRASCVVVTVGYRLAPEHPFPAAFEDAVKALRWVHSDKGAQSLGIDRSRTAVGGTSAGGQLCASLVMKVATLEPPIPIKFQLLVVPVIDNTASVDGIWAQNQNAPWLTPARMSWYQKMYLPNEHDRKLWEASPNLAPVTLLSKSPKTWIAISEQDLLGPEAQRYASQLSGAGVHVETKVYQGSTHSILAMSGEMLPSDHCAINADCSRHSHEKQRIGRRLHESSGEVVR